MLLQTALLEKLALHQANLHKKLIDSNDEA